MKNLLLRITLPLSIVALLAAGIVTGCEKKDKLNELNSVVQTKQATTTGVTSEEEYQSVFDATTAMLEQGMALRIIRDPKGYIFEVIKEQEPGPLNRDPCKSTSGATLSFAQCCKAYVMAEGCIMVTHSGNNWTGGPCPRN